MARIDPVLLGTKKWSLYTFFDDLSEEAYLRGALIILVAEAKSPLDDYYVACSSYVVCSCCFIDKQRGCFAHAELLPK
jgi:hypothetical protein